MLFQKWVQLWGEKIMSNCMHFYQIGNAYDLLFNWENLCRYSQQGCEALNGAMIFFGRTNRGSHTGKHNRKSELAPIARWLQRRLIFIRGCDEIFLITFLIKIQICH